MCIVFFTKRSNIQMIPRNYQRELFRIACEQNSILYLPTGAGKTFISIMLMKHYAPSLVGPHGKRIIFVAPMVELVEQQAKVIHKHSSFEVGYFVGHMNVDDWSSDTWRKKFAEHEVLVMSAQILLNCLDSGVIKMNQLSLLVVDECHHTTEKHPMNMIMKNHYKADCGTRIVGLTATPVKGNLSLHQINKEVATLEQNLCSKIVKLDCIDELKGFYADPNVKLELVDPAMHTESFQNALAELEELETYISSMMELEKKEPQKLMIPFYIDGILVQSKKSLYREIKRMLMDCVNHFTNLGTYGGSIALLIHTISIQRTLCVCQKESFLTVLKLVASSMARIRKTVKDGMTNGAVGSNPLLAQFSSPKVLHLVHIVSQHIKELTTPDNDAPEVDTTLRAIVFVQRRVTAKILYQIFKELSKQEPAFKMLRPDFIVGRGCKALYTREHVLDDRKSRAAMIDFAMGKVNLIVSSSVLEEGMDVPKCNLVIKFDSADTFSSFIQSKGRAREQDANFYILHEKENRDINQAVSLYRKIETELQSLQSESKTIDSTQIQEEETYVTALGAKVRPSNAVPLVYRFCQSLSVDKFSDMAPLWFKGKSFDGVTYTVFLPLNPHFRQPITGDKKGKFQDARDSAAFNAIKILHKIKALDDQLKPSREQLNEMMESKELFPNWQEEPKGLPNTRGTTKCKDTHDMHVPKVLRDCAPREGLVYMHLVILKPAGQLPSDSRRQTFHKLVEDQTESLALLSSNPWPKLCQFPIFMGVGRVMVTIAVNHTKLTISREILDLAREFHMSLLNDLLGLNKAFLQYNFESGINNYLVVPTIAVPHSTEVSINVDLLFKRPNLKVPDTPITGNETNLYLKVVKPWYRIYDDDTIPGENKNYIVTGICEYLNPDSPFPNNQNSIVSYRQYYQQKYELEITNSSQPLLEVKSINSKINYLTPRPPLKAGKRKRDQPSDVNEIFVPELCKLVGAVSFVSAQLWLKTTAMPSVLLRMTHLLVAEELRAAINQDTGLGLSEIPVEWEPMVVNEKVEVTNSKKFVQPTGYGPPQVKTLAPNISQIKMPWDESRELEPIDVDKNLEHVTLLEIREYDQFARKVNEEINIKSTAITNQHHERDQTIRVKPIALLTPCTTMNGPQQHTIYAALTTTSANEGLDMERLECLGDSYLKFATSLYLFCTSQQTEGALTNVKGKLVSNRNLFYCGRKRNIGSCMNPMAIAINTEWKVPNLEVDVKFKQLVEQSYLKIDDLEHLCLSDEEKKNGQVLESTWENLLELVVDDVEVSQPKEASVYDGFLDKQCLPDKRVADCVEAVIGAYVESCGTRATAKLLSWFQILPPTIESLMTDSTALVGVRASDLPDASFKAEVERLLIGTNSLEKQLNYSFKNRDILLQAISHASFISNRLTDSFQRLEFLGDAVLDFLITSFIYEQYHTLTPGQLTDLRSALVNNITFASLTVRFGFYQHLRYESSNIMTSVEKFVRYQEEHDHCINGDYLLLYQEDSVRVAQSIEVPKILGDIWESLAGAVFLDSGKDLATTWKVFYPLMKTEIDLFSANIPKQAVRMLYESVVEKSVEFEKPEQVEDSHYVMIKLILDFKDKKHNFYGVGENKILAKTAAAKCALRFITNYQLQLQQNPQI